MKAPGYSPDLREQPQADDRTPHNQKRQGRLWRPPGTRRTQRLQRRKNRPDGPPNVMQQHSNTSDRYHRDGRRTGDCTGSKCRQRLRASWNRKDRNIKVHCFGHRMDRKAKAHRGDGRLQPLGKLQWQPRAEGARAGETSESSGSRGPQPSRRPRPPTPWGSRPPPPHVWYCMRHA